MVQALKMCVLKICGLIKKGHHFLLSESIFHSRIINCPLCYREHIPDGLVEITCGSHSVYGPPAHIINNTLSLPSSQYPKKFQFHNFDQNLRKPPWEITDQSHMVVTSCRWRATMGTNPVQTPIISGLKPFHMVLPMLMDHQNKRRAPMETNSVQTLIISGLKVLHMIFLMLMDQQNKRRAPMGTNPPIIPGLRVFHTTLLMLMDPHNRTRLYP